MKARAQRRRAVALLTALGQAPPAAWSDDIADYPSQVPKVSYDIRAREQEARVRAKFGWTDED